MDIIQMMGSCRELQVGTLPVRRTWRLSLEMPVCHGWKAGGGARNHPQVLESLEIFSVDSISLPIYKEKAHYEPKWQSQSYEWVSAELSEDFIFRLFTSIRAKCFSGGISWQESFCISSMELLYGIQDLKSCSCQKELCLFLIYYIQLKSHPLQETWRNRCSSELLYLLIHPYVLCRYPCRNMTDTSG